MVVVVVGCLLPAPQPATTEEAAQGNEWQRARAGGGGEGTALASTAAALSGPGGMRWPRKRRGHGRPTAGPMAGRHVVGKGGDADVCGGAGHSLKGGGGIEGSRGRAGGGKYW